MKFFSLVTLFAHYFLTIDSEMSVTITYRQNSRNRRFVHFTKEITTDPDTSVPDPLLQRMQSKFQAQDINSKENDLISFTNQKNSKSIFLNPYIGEKGNKSAKAKVTDEKRSLIDKENDYQREKTRHKGLIDKSGVARENYNHNKSSIKIHETVDSTLNSFNLSHSSKTPWNNSAKSFFSSSVSTEHENALPNDGFKTRLEKTEKGNPISSILGGKSSLELTSSKNGDSKNKKAEKGSSTKLEKSRRSGEESAMEECQHAITSSRDKWSQFCKLLFLLQAENVNKLIGKTSNRITNEILNIKGQNITRMKESQRSNLPRPKSRYKSPETQVKLSSFQPYQTEPDSDSTNFQTQGSIFQVENEGSLENARKIENGNLQQNNKKSSLKENFEGHLYPERKPHTKNKERADNLKQENFVPTGTENEGHGQRNLKNGVIYNLSSKIKAYNHATENYSQINSFSELRRPDKQLKINFNMKEEKLDNNTNINKSFDKLNKDKSFQNSDPTKIEKKIDFSNNTSYKMLRIVQDNSGNKSMNTVNIANLEEASFTESFVTTKQSTIINNYSVSTNIDNPKNAFVNVEKHFRKEISEAKQNSSQNNSATTLPSVFKENLIPPLPQKWPENGAEELWTDLDSQEIEQTLSSNDEDFYSNKDDDYGNETKKNESFQKENISMPVVFDKISFIERDASHNYTEEKYRPPDADYDEYVLESPSSDFKNRSKHLKEAIPTVRIAGKADMSDTPVSNVKERISFITVPPGTHWHLWGGFPGRRRADPIFEMGRANGTGDVSQVYTAYWGSNPDSSSFLTGIWILRIGAGVGLLTLVLTVAAQTVRFCQPLFSQKAVLTTNLSTSLAAAHVVFIFGIQATEGLWICGVVALFLHFLYLLTCNWILALSIRLLRGLLQKKPFHTAAYCIPVWIASLAVIVVSYGVNPSGYETRRFCWQSIERGMIFAFIGPVCTLLLVNAGVCIACQKILLDVTIHRDSNDKNDLRAGVALLPLHGVAWFLTAVALEDDLSLALDCAAALATAAVGCMTLHFYVPDWQQFLYQYLPCPLPSTPGNKSLIPIAMATSLESPNLTFTEAQLPHQPSTTSYSLSSSSSTTALLEEHQLDCIYSSGYRREAY